MAISSFRDLRVWQAGIDLVEVVYRLTQDFPPQEQHGLTSQMRRAGVSVPANVAEGHAREHLNEYLHHVSIAQGSLAELETHIEIAGRLGFLPSDAALRALDQVNKLSRQLYALRNAPQRSR